MRFLVGVIGAAGYIARDYRQEIREAVDEARIAAEFDNGAVGTFLLSNKEL